MTRTSLEAILSVCTRRLIVCNLIEPGLVFACVQSSDSPAAEYEALRLSPKTQFTFACLGCGPVEVVWTSSHRQLIPTPSTLPIPSIALSSQIRCRSYAISIETTAAHNKIAIHPGYPSINPIRLLKSPTTQWARPFIYQTGSTTSKPCITARAPLFNFSTFQQHASPAAEYTLQYRAR